MLVILENVRTGHLIECDADECDPKPASAEEAIALTVEAALECYPGTTADEWRILQWHAQSPTRA